MSKKSDSVREPLNGSDQYHKVDRQKLATEVLTIVFIMLIFTGVPIIIPQNYPAIKDYIMTSPQTLAFMIICAYLIR